MAAWGSQYKMSFYDHFDVLTEIYIKKYNYAGAETEVNGGEDPLRINLNSNGSDKFQYIRGTSAEIDLISETNFQFIGIHTADAHDYKIEIYKATVLCWQGWLLTDFYQEPYEQPPYIVTIYATDGLGLLKFYDYDGATGKKSLLNVLDVIFAKINLSLTPTTNLYENINVYEENISSTAADSLLDQIYLNADIFYDPDGNAMNCYDVLVEILKLLKAYITQSGGAWHIIQVPTNLVPYTRRLWTWGGSSYSYTSNASFNPVVATTSASVVKASLVRFVGNMLTISAAWKQFITKQDYGTKDNIIENGEFRYSTFTWTGARWTCDHWDDINTPVYSPFPVSLNQPGYMLPKGIEPRWTGVRGSGVIGKGRGNILWYLTYDPDYEYCIKINGNDAIGTAYGIENNEVEIVSSTDDLLFHIEFLVDDSSAVVYCQVIIDIAGTPDWYLLNSGAWTNTPSYITFSNNQPFQWITKEILAAGIPGDGTLRVRLYQCITAGGYIKYKNVRFIYLPSDLQPVKSFESTTTVETNNLYIPADLILMTGDLPDHDNKAICYNNGLYYLSGIYIPTLVWFDKNIDICVNGIFDGDTDWTKEAGWSISEDYAEGDATTANLYQAVLTVGVRYRITYTVSNLTGGTVRCMAGTTVGTTRSANGTYTEFLTCAGNTNLIIDGVTAFTGRIDNVSALPCDTLVNLMIDAIAYNNSEAWQILTGVIYSKLISWITIIQETNNSNKKFMINSGVYHVKAGAWDVELLQLIET